MILDPYYNKTGSTLYLGDCLSVMGEMEDNSVDAIVTDPPYGLSKQPDIVEVLSCWLNEDDYEHSSGGFMGKDWDSFIPNPAIWKECLRILKPGGYLLAFAGTRTQDLMGISLRLGGFEIRDTIAWIYGEGFPKSANISKQMDKAAGMEREVIGTKQWDGWGTGLKPSNEPIIWTRKPLTVVPLDDIIQVSNLIGGLICLSISSVKYVETLLALNPQELRGESVSVRIIAGLNLGLHSGDLLEKMDMFKSPGMAKTTLNIVELWSSILDAVWLHQNTFTTKMGIELTTQLKTLESLILPIIQEVITPGVIQMLGQPLNANTAERNSSGLYVRCKKETSVQEFVSLLLEQNAVCNVEQSFTNLGHIVNTVLENVITNLGERISPNLLPIIMCRKPISEKTIAANVLRWGTGAINIDGCRVGDTVETWPKTRSYGTKGKKFDSYENQESKTIETGAIPNGRWPANLILDDSEEVRELFPETGASKRSNRGRGFSSAGSNGGWKRESHNNPEYQNVVGGYNDNGSAARFFYVAKSSTAERSQFCEGEDKNTHATVKPIALMRQLIRLITPPGGIVLDPFSGSGSTLVAAQAEGFKAIGIELEEKYCAITAGRLRQPSLFSAQGID